MEHHFDIEHAESYGIEEAILINHFIFWLTKNKANHKTIKEIELKIDEKIQRVKRVFTYNSVSAMQEIFPYMNDKKIYRVIESLIEQKVIVRKYFNSNSYNRTSWYCFYDEGHFLKMGNGKDKNGKSNSQKQEMDLPETGNHYKDNNKDKEKDNNKDMEPNSLTITQQLKDFAKSNNLVYELNFREDQKSQSKLVSELSITNEQVLKQVERLKPILADSKCDWWSKTNSFGFNYMLKNWGRIDSWHNAYKPKVREFKKPEIKSEPVKFSESHLDTLKEFLA